jgi:hypothetical protein
MTVVVALAAREHAILKAILPAVRQTPYVVDSCVIENLESFGIGSIPNHWFVAPVARRSFTVAFVYQSTKRTAGA